MIIIFLDADRFLAEAVESAFAQTYGDWELLLVNDGSRDRSEAIARSYVARDPQRVRYLEHPGGENRGMSATRNLGMSHARGEFVAFLDADDVWLPGKLEHQTALLDRFQDAAMVYGPTMLWYEWQDGGHGADRDMLRPLGVAPGQLIRPPSLIPLFLRGDALPPSTCGLLVRRSAALQVGGFEDAFRGMHEDQAFLYKLCLAEPVFVSGECFDLYRQHGTSASARAQAEGSYDANGPNVAQRQFLEWFRDHAAAAGALDAEIEAALDDAFWPYRHPRAAWLGRRAAGAWAKLRRLLRG